MEYVDDEGATLDLAGNFEFNGLVVFLKMHTVYTAEVHPKLTEPC